jgi:hypothetical protein
MMVIDGASHGRKFGFGCKLDHVLLLSSDTRARPTRMDLTLSSSELTQQQSHMFSSQEVMIMMQEKEQ